MIFQISLKPVSSSKKGLAASVSGKLPEIEGRILELQEATDACRLIFIKTQGLGDKSVESSIETELQLVRKKFLIVMGLRFPFSWLSFKR